MGTGRTGRPPKPVEQHKSVGTYRPDRHAPSTGSVTPLRGLSEAPDPPVELLLEGRALWERAWASAITWLSPESDWDAVVEACQLADDVSQARRRYRATSDPSDARAVVALSRELQACLANLGFNPAARSRLGVAEVKKLSALDELMLKRRGQSG
jgi:hypothetical protein